jgi:ribulose 1,5-bisphosphate synthetase/thiazole synthase
MRGRVESATRLENTVSTYLQIATADAPDFEGAGPVGLTMAEELARFGVAVRIIGRSPHPTETPGPW